MAANAWPGFVDILSAVVIMFVFFVLITAAVLYFYTITYKAKYEGQVAVTTQVQEAIDTLKFEALERENRELREQIEADLAKALPSGGSEDAEVISENEATQTFGAQNSEQALTSSLDDGSLVLFHDVGAITVDSESEQRITDFIDQLTQRHGAENLEILLNSPKLADASTQNQAKRLAVARMLNVRNALLKSTVDRANIQLTVVESEEIDESANWTRLQVNVLK